MKAIKTTLITVFTLLLTQIAIANSTNDDSLNKATADCGISKVNDNNGQNDSGGFSTKLTSVIQNNNGTYTIQVLISHDGCGGPSCKELSHFSIKATTGSYSNVSWNSVTGNTNGNIALSLGNNDPFDGFKLDNINGIGGGNSGSFTMTYTLSSLQNQQFLAKAGNNYTQLSHFSVAEFQSVLDCQNPSIVCSTADNTTSNASISENQTKPLSGNPTGGTWSIVSGGGTINGSIYTPANINTNTNVTIKYTIAADGSCAETFSNVAFTVTPVCETANNTTSNASITESETKTLSGNPTGGTWSIVSGGGTINGTIYTPANINTDTNVTIKYTVAADGSCDATTSDVTFTVTKNTICTQSPTEKAQGFNIFTLESLSLETNETEGSVATGGDLTLLGNYQVATNNPGTFKVNNVPIGLLVGGKINYQSGNSLQVNQNTYIKIGNSQGSTVWYKDQNNAYANIRITQNSNYNSSPRISLQANANQLNVSTTNNPVFQSNIIDFSSAFQTLRANSVTLSQATNNAQLTNPNGQSIPNSSLPNQVKINLQNGVNYLNVTGTDLNNVSVFTYNNAPSATKVLVINVDASGVFNWNVWNQAGVGQQNAPYIIYNFYNTTTLNIKGNSTIEGTVFAPFADIIKSVNRSNIEGQVIGKSFTHSGGEVHSANFTPTIGSCNTVSGVPPTSVFTVNNNEQCFNNNEFVFNNTSNTGASVQTADPITYVWNFGDGTSSTLMNPTKTYSVSGTYTVSLTATNTFGTNTSTKQVVVLANTAPILTETKTTTGTGSITKEVTLTNNTVFSQFSWALAGDGSNLFQNQSTISFTFSQAGTYNVTVTAIKNGCTSTATISLIVTSNEVTIKEIVVV